MDRIFWRTIRGKLLLINLLLVLLPVVALGGAAIFAIRSLDDSTQGSLQDVRTEVGDTLVGAQASEIAHRISRELSVFIDERVDDATFWSKAPTIVESAVAGGVRAESLGLTELSIDQIEAQYLDAPQLGDAAATTELLRAIDGTAFKEVFFTDSHGYNVAYSSPTSDFVQSDEDWWQSAWTTGLAVGEPEFDASANVFAVDISVRIDDGDRPVGVMKAVLDIQIVQEIASRFSGGKEDYDVTVVARDGRYLADTASGHDPEQILSAANATVDGNARVRAALAFEPGADGAADHYNGYIIDDVAVGGFDLVSEEIVELQDGDTRTADAFEWVVVVEEPTEIAFAALAPFAGLQDSVSSTSSGLTLVIAAIALVAILAAAAMSILFARRITRPIARLRDAAVEASEVRLPEYVALVDRLDPDEELPALESIIIETGDEVEDLAHSFDAIQQTAAMLAAEQAKLRRRNVAATFVNLGRRNQSLLSRQLEHINSMEKTETSPETLGRLFQLDHLATRMRRNAESLLVLAGEETPRQFRRPVSVYQLVQAAGAEIEDYDRLDFVALDDANVEGGAATDIAHLLAELLENASKFSPPGTTIQIHGRRRDNGYSLVIMDQGIGMEEEELATANARLADPAEFDRGPSAYLGLFVAAHLARRHGLRVKLSESPFGGVTAKLSIPADVIVSADEERAPEGDAARAADDDLPRRPLIDPVPTSSSVFDAPVPADGKKAVPVLAEPTSTGSNGTRSTAIVPPAESPRAVEATIGVGPSTFDSVPAAAVLPSPAVADAVSSSPADVDDTTPSGFRRRRRGHEGAPVPKAQHTADVPHRDAREVQASLQRFRSGVEHGRSQPDPGLPSRQPIAGGTEQ